MTTNQAWREARRRWGNKALIEIRKKPVIYNGHVISGTHIVGRNMLGLFFEVRGDGSSWEHAFAMSTWFNHPRS